MLDRFDNFFQNNITSHLFSVQIKDNNNFFVLILSGCRKIAIRLKELILSDQSLLIPLVGI